MAGEAAAHLAPDGVRRDVAIADGREGDDAVVEAVDARPAVGGGDEVGVRGEDVGVVAVVADVLDGAEHKAADDEEEARERSHQQVVGVPEARLACEESWRRRARHALALADSVALTSDKLRDLLVLSGARSNRHGHHLAHLRRGWRAGGGSFGTGRVRRWAVGGGRRRRSRGRVLQGRQAGLRPRRIHVSCVPCSWGRKAGLLLRCSVCRGGSALLLRGLLRTHQVARPLRLLQ